MPESLPQKPPKSPLYEGISIKTEDESIKSYYTFDTEPKEEFDEYTRPEISLMLSAKED